MMMILSPIGVIKSAGFESDFHYPMIHARPLLSSGDDKKAYNDWAGMILLYRCVCRDDLALHLSVKTLIPLWEHRKVTHPSLGAS